MLGSNHRSSVGGNHGRTTKHIEQRHAELFGILADLNAGLKFGSITTLEQVRDIVAPLFPAPTALVATPASPSGDNPDLVANVATQFQRMFRPQPTRGSAPANPQTLLAKGNDL